MEYIAMDSFTIPIYTASFTLDEDLLLVELRARFICLFNDLSCLWCRICFVRFFFFAQFMHNLHMKTNHKTKVVKYIFCTRFVSLLCREQNHLFILNVTHDVDREIFRKQIHKTFLTRSIIHRNFSINCRNHFFHKYLNLIFLIKRMLFFSSASLLKSDKNR